MKLVNHLVMTTLLASACSTAFAAGSDDLWEMNISLNSGGQSRPLHTMQNCMLKGQDHPNPPDKSCKVSGAAGKGPMSMECAGPPPYSVKIEGTRTSNSMKGTMTVISSGTTMVQEFNGKIIGSCDAATFVAKAPGGMPSGGMSMPSFNRSSLPPRQAGNSATAPDATPSAPPPQGNANPMDAAKKALGGLLPF